MNSMIEGTISGIVALAIYEIGKNIIVQLRPDDEKQLLKINDVQEYVSNKLGAKYVDLFTSGIFEKVMKSPLIEDTIYNYTLYILFGKAVEVKNIPHFNFNKNRNIEEKDLIKFFSRELYEKYDESETTFVFQTTVMFIKMLLKQNFLKFIRTSMFQNVKLSKLLMIFLHFALTVQNYLSLHLGKIIISFFIVPFLNIFTPNICSLERKMPKKYIPFGKNLMLILKFSSSLSLCLNKKTK